MEAKMAKELNESNFSSSIEKGIAIVDFWAPWCGPCKMMTPVIEKIANENPNLIVAKVNVDECPGIAQKYNILSIPTIIIFKDGEPSGQTIGVVTEKVIMEKVKAI
jgi:thioredoxin 1